MPIDSLTLYYASGTRGVQPSRLISEAGMCFQESGPARSQAGQAVAPSFAGESGILVHAFRHYHEAATLKGRHDRYAFGECPPRCAALIVTRDLAGVATSRLAMSDGRQSALAGTL